MAKRLQQARLRAGISQKKLGILAGMDEFVASARINQYERDKHMLDFETAGRLAKALAVPTPFLYAKDDALAAWILIFDRVAAAVRQSVLKKVPALES